MAQEIQREKASENRKHTGGGEQDRRPLESGDPTIEKNPVRDRDGRTAQDRKPAQEAVADEARTCWVRGAEGWSALCW